MLLQNFYYYSAVDIKVQQIKANSSISFYFYRHSINKKWLTASLFDKQVQVNLALYPRLAQ